MFVTNWICLSCGDNISQNKQCKWDLKYLERSFFSLWSYVSSIVFTASSLLLSNSSVLLTFSSWIWQVLPSYEHSHILYELVVTMREHSTSLLTGIVKKRKKERALTFQKHPFSSSAHFLCSAVFQFLSGLIVSADTCFFLQSDKTRNKTTSINFKQLEIMPMNTVMLKSCHYVTKIKNILFAEVSLQRKKKTEHNITLAVIYLLLFL